jgi:hypothetical protein
MDNNHDVFELLTLVAQPISRQALIPLILDLYSVHRSETSKARAFKLGIVMHFTPAGWIDILQSLDRYISGALKTIG